MMVRSEVALDQYVLPGLASAATSLALFAGSLASVDEEQVVALLEVIDHEGPLTWTPLEA